MDQQKLIDNISETLHKYNIVRIMLRNTPNPNDPGNIEYTSGVTNDLEMVCYMRAFLLPIKMLDENDLVGTKVKGETNIIDRMSVRLDRISIKLEQIGATFAAEPSSRLKPLPSEVCLIEAFGQLYDNVSMIIRDIFQIADMIKSWDDNNMTPERSMVKTMFINAKSLVNIQRTKFGTFPGYFSGRILESIDYIDCNQ